MGLEYRVQAGGAVGGGLQPAAAVDPEYKVQSFGFAGGGSSRFCGGCGVKFECWDWEDLFNE